MNKFEKKLNKIIKKNNSLVCVGLDAEMEKIPQHLLKKRDPVFSFNKAIIDSTYDLVCAYKPNIAFYEAEGIKGLKALKRTISYLKTEYPNIPVILDAKRADIGNTNISYIRSFFNDLGVDAVTLHPYLGLEALGPFLALKDKYFFILCKTSNPGAEEFQNLHIDRGLKLYEYIARNVARKWNYNQNCGLVAGATYPRELKEIRLLVGDMLLLIPGIGTQGADVKKTILAGENSRRRGMIINSSRGIIFASQGRDFNKTARKKTLELRDLINKYR